VLRGWRCIARAIVVAVAAGRVVVVFLIHLYNVLARG
jgi:hypothetical protein